MHLIREWLWKMTNTVIISFTFTVSTFGVEHKSERNADIVSKKLKDKKGKSRNILYCPCEAEDEYFRNNLKNITGIPSSYLCRGFLFNSFLLKTTKPRAKSKTEAGSGIVAIQASV